MKTFQNCCVKSDRVFFLLFGGALLAYTAQLNLTQLDPAWFGLPHNAYQIAA